MGSSNGQIPPFKRLPPEIRQAVIDDLKSGSYGRNEIARRNNIGNATVTKIAKEEDLETTKKTTVTETATRAMAVDFRARRETLKADLMNDIQALRVRAWSRWSKQVVTKEGIEEFTADMPPLPEVASAYRAIGICLDGIFKLEAVEAASSDSVQGARDFLMEFQDNLRAARTEFEARTGLAMGSREANNLVRGTIIDNNLSDETE